MGLGFFKKTCCLTPPNMYASGRSIRDLGKPIKPIYPNPNPARFSIKETIQIGKVLVAKVHYPDCTNYEGVKVLVFSNCKDEDLRKRKTLDPHFSPFHYVETYNLHLNGPIARFEPSDKGWELAIKFAEMISANSKSQNNKVFRKHRVDSHPYVQAETVSTKPTNENGIKIQTSHPIRKLPYVQNAVRNRPMLRRKIK